MQLTYKELQSYLVKQRDIYGFDLACHRENGKIVFTNIADNRNHKWCLTAQEAWAFMDGFMTRVWQ